MDHLMFGAHTALFALCVGLALMGVWPQKARAEESGPPVIGWVEIEPAAGRPGHIVIMGKVHGVRPTEGLFTLQVRRHEQGNISNGNQSGVFKVEPGENTVLSRTMINAPATGSIEIIFKLSASGREISATHLAQGF